jgi:hypothetical protein
MPKTWQAALAAYRYPVTKPFSHSSDYSQWQHQPELPTGDRAETIAFEDYFRASGQSSIGPWAEVVFWKLASQGGRADIRTREVLDRWEFTRPESLWSALTAYVEAPTEVRFDRFRSLFGFKTKAIAITATFPAFLAPDRFPMVDTRIAKWVKNHFDEHNAIDPVGPQLVPKSHEYGLSMRDFAFMRSWSDWCRHTARKLVALTEEQWRARDVEMAVFQAQGGSVALNALPPS